MNNFIKLNQPMEKEINLKGIFRIIKRQFWVVAILTVLFTIIGGIYSTYFTTPLYQSSSRIIIKTDKESQQTLQVIIKDSTIMEKVVQDLDLDRSPEKLAGQINVQSVDGSQVVSIGVIDTDPKLAADIANATAKVFKEEIPSVVDFANVQLLSDGKIYPEPINNNQKRSIMIGFLIGLFSGIGLILFRHSLDDSVKSEEEVEEFLRVSVLGKVSKMKKRNLQKKNQEQEIELGSETIG